MTEVYDELTVFIASPGNCEREREKVRKVADEVTQTLGLPLGVRIRVTGWEDVQPDVGRPQDIINPLLDECDVFVGLLGLKWGSPTGTHDSGFLEEFERIVQRRGDDETPRIALFFRTVPPERLEDPGPQLKAVLDFQQLLRDQNLALYQQFEDVDGLATLLWRLFADQVARIGSVGPEREIASGSEPGSTVSDDEGTDRAANVELDDARRQVSETTDAVTQIVRGERPNAPIDNDRLLLFALALNSDGGHVPAHVANRLFRRRSELALAPAELEIWLRSLLADIGRSSSREGRVIPGWALVDIPERQIRNLLLDSDTLIASGMLRTLSRVGRRPDQLWRQGTGDAPDVAATWAEILRRTGVSLAASEYLATCAREEDLPMLDAILEIEDSNPITELRALLVGDMMPIAKAVATSFSSPAWKRELISGAIPDGSDDSVRILAVGEKTPVEIRLLAFNELEKRGAVDSAVVESLLRESQTAEALVNAALGLTAQLGPERLSEILSEVSSKSLHGAEVEARLKSATSTTAELLAMLDAPGLVLDAWEALGWKSDEILVERARSMYDSNGAPITDSPEVRDALDERVLTYVQGRSRVSALRILTAQHPLADEDRERVYRELAREDWYTRGETLTMLASFAGPQDLRAVIDGLDKIHGGDLERIVDTILRVGGIHAARMLAKSERAVEAIPAIRRLGADDEVPDDELVELLYEPTDAIRIAALDQLTQRLTSEELAELLNDYPTRRGTYFYNVIAELDWLLNPDPHISATAGT